MNEHVRNTVDVLLMGVHDVLKAFVVALMILSSLVTGAVFHKPILGAVNKAIPAVYEYLPVNSATGGPGGSPPSIKMILMGGEYFGKDRNYPLVI